MTRKVACALGLGCLVGSCAPRPVDRVAAAVELDHVYVYAPAGSVEDVVIHALTSVGLAVEPRRNEFGDGVVGRYVRFENAYLELLWYDGKTATDAETRRRATWESSGASPFGLGLHRRAGVSRELPFPTRSVVEPWMRPGAEFRKLGGVNDFAAPDLFVVADSPTNRRPGLQPLGIRRLTGVRVTVISGDETNGVALINRSELAAIQRGVEPLLELVFDVGNKNRSLDFRPQLPLTMMY